MNLASPSNDFVYAMECGVDAAAESGYGSKILRYVGKALAKAKAGGGIQEPFRCAALMI